MKKIMVFLLGCCLSFLVGCNFFTNTNKEMAEMMDLVNNAQFDASPSVVKIYKFAYTSLDDYNDYNYDADLSTLGSGVIFNYKFIEDTYYVITNNHVTIATTPYIRFYIYDAFGREYASVMDLEIGEANYDLAVLTFQGERGEMHLPIMTFLNRDFTSPEVVIAIGNPTGLNNVLTVGKIIAIINPPLIKDSVDNDESSKSSTVNVKVYHHSAPIKGGSSGGALVYYDAKSEQYYLCGINYAGGTDDNVSQETSSSFAIRSTSVLEYLEQHNISYYTN